MAKSNQQMSNSSGYGGGGLKFKDVGPVLAPSY